MAYKETPMKERIRGALREIFSRYHAPRKAVMARAAKYLPAYNKDGSLSKKPNKVTTCSVCKGEFKDKEIECDHTEVVGRTPDWPPKLPGEWEAWMSRLLCDEDGLRAICKKCHLAVSKPQWEAMRKERELEKMGKVRRKKRSKARPKKGSRVGERKPRKGRHTGPKRDDGGREIRNG